MRPAALLLLLTVSTDAWVPQGSASTRGLAPLSAKKTTKKKKAVTASTAGGFGAPPKPVDDYAVFPRLESDVTSTLVPSPPILYEESGVLPTEIYERLDQIYGFPRFNYIETTEEPLSMNELLGSSDSLLSSPQDDLGGLFGSPTAVETKPQSTLALESLPPFSDFRVLHIDPLVLAVDDFFTDDECDRYVDLQNSSMQSRSPTVGKDAAAKAQRTSTTFYHHFETVPELMAKASRLLGLNSIDKWEEPQTVRYRRKEKFTWHLDALGPTENHADLGGQRTATLLVYLTDLSEEEGGATMFRDLGGSDGPLRVQPKKGSALLFFPSAGGIPDAPFDIRTLHCGEAVKESSTQDKWIGQLWLRQGRYTPTAPAGNLHSAASDAISAYCQR